MIYSTHLPTLGQLKGESDESGEVKGYVAAGYDLFVKYLAVKKYNGDIEKAAQKANTYKVLPIISDPTEKDSDNDDLMDINDPKPCDTNKWNVIYNW